VISTLRPQAVGRRAVVHLLFNHKNTKKKEKTEKNFPRLSLPFLCDLCALCGSSCFYSGVMENPARNVGICLHFAARILPQGRTGAGRMARRSLFMS